MESRKNNRAILQKFKMEVGRFTVPYAVTGSGQHTLIAVNGAQQTMASWFSLRKYFAGFPSVRLVLLDFPGQGRAEIKEGSPEVEIEEHISVLRAVAKKVSPKKKISIVGGSWGGVVAAAYAARYPDHVSKLILGSFGTKPNEKLLDIIDRGQAIFQEERWDEVATLLIDGFGTALTDTMKIKLRAQFKFISIDHLRHLYAQTFVFQACQDIAEYVDLGAITADTLIVNGANDPIVDTRDTEIAVSRIPRCRCRLLPDVGHFLHLEKPEVMDIYCSFLLGDSFKAPARV